MQILLVFFLQGLQGLALNLAHILQKMKLLLQDLKIFARVLQEKIVNNFLARFDQSLARKLCYNFFARFFISYKESFNFSARLARYSARSCKFCKKNTCKTWIFLQVVFYLERFHSFYNIIVE